MPLSRKSLTLIPAYAVALVGIASFALAAPPPQTKAGRPLPGLTANQAFQFEEGREYYSTPLTLARGLGPAFNQSSCASCHDNPVGGWGTTTVTHFGNLVGSNFDYLEALGGPVMQQQAISPSCREFLPSPAIANHVRARVTPSVLAFGLVEAIADSSIIALEDPNDSNGDGISGRAHRVQPLETPTGPLRIGRFGWKAQIATVLSFSGDAARTEMGLTNRVVAQETAPNGDTNLLASCDTVQEIEDQEDSQGVTFVDAVTAFQRYLAPPPQSPRSGMTGEAIFNQISCVQCHVRAFTTPNDPALESALRDKTIPVYSDFLLHDMGALGDGIPDGQALGAEMKTPPLWNLRTRPAMLHDGSVSSGNFTAMVTAAINAHAGEAAASRAAFFALSAPQQAQVIAFLDSLGKDDYDVDGDRLITRQDFSQVILNSFDSNVTADEAWAVADLNQNHLLDFDEVDQLRVMLGIASDCNQNGVADWTEIASGAALDEDTDGIPDECDQSVCTRKAIRVTGTGGAIPDNSATGLTKILVIPALPGNPTIQSMRVTLNINHTWLNDLTITLKRGTDPDIFLHTGCGTTNDLLGKYLLVDTAWEGAPASLQPVCLGARIDQGGSNPDTRFRIEAGTYRPTQGTEATGFSSMRGQPLAATWTLKIVDGSSHAGDTPGGTLVGWSIEARYNDPIPTDCDGFGGADCLQIANDSSLDCDQNGTIDSCESISTDCDSNGIKDRCQIFAGTDFDCNANGILDSCDVASGIVRDCDANGTPDSCDIAGGAPDADMDGILDSCEFASGDLNLDGEINGMDLALVLSNWGGSGFADVNRSGVVDGADLAAILSHWGQSPPWVGPTVSSVSPTSGSTLGGTAITITGTALTGASSVTVGGVAATSVVVVSSTSITAVTPAGAAGAKNIAVTTAAGTATLSGGFTYVAPAPTVSSVSPASGSTLGGTAITITGTNLTGASSVTVGGVAATSVVVVSSTSITAVTPAGTAGAKTIAVTTAGGTASLTNGFTYVVPAPTVSSVSPTSGSTLGGTAITITGANLTGASSVTVGGVAATSVVVVSSTSITAVTPAGAAGGKTVAVTTAGGTATVTNGFTYVVPSVWYTVIQQTVDAAVVTNVAMRNAITASGLPWRVRDNGTNIEMLLVPKGTFTMGCTASNANGCFSDENPTHSVTLTQAFYMGRYEVTQGQWVATMGSNPSSFQGASYPDAANRPVERVSWNTIQGYLSATGMRLPSEAEWEYACRAGTTAAFNNGSSDDNTAGNIAWYSSNSGNQTHAVGGKAANALGLHDMAGNVWEWVNDWYGSAYYSVSPSNNPLGPVSGESRVLRGGSLIVDTSGVRSSYRLGVVAPLSTNNNIGFRVARDVVPAPAPTVSSVSPTSGSTLGGTAITITGANLTGASSVTVGGVAATSVVVVSPTSITAVTPAGTAGAKNVAVTTAGGTATVTNGFTYQSIIVPTWATLVEAMPDPAVVTNSTLRAAITATGLAWRVRDTATQMEMLLVPPGTFTMGCTASNQYACLASENPTHSVTLTQAFYLGRYEVTQGQWVAKMGSNPSAFQGASYPDAANRPVEQVSWNTIQGYLSATGMRLPSEAEWEYACRAGTTTAFNNGSSDDATVGTIAWYSSNSGNQTHAVGGKAANALGLHDMSGNVYEWVNDWYGSTYYSVSPSTNPLGPVSGTNRVFRGGSWIDLTGVVRSSYRSSTTPGSAVYNLGFRVARAP